MSVDPLPVIAYSCSLTYAELGEQRARYRTVGNRAEVVEWTARRRAVRVAASVPEALIERVIEVERQCCPFFELSWDPGARRLTVSVSEADQEPALDALTYALGVTQPVH